MWNPESIGLLQHAVRTNGDGTGAQEKYDEYSKQINEDASRRATLRGLLKFRFGAQDEVPLEEVEPGKEIVKRFATGAMSLGSISTPAHETLAGAMNRLGGKSNTGEGGEDPRCFNDAGRTEIYPVASGDVGVTSLLRDNVDQ